MVRLRALLLVSALAAALAGFPLASYGLGPLDDDDDDGDPIECVGSFTGNVDKVVVPSGENCVLEQSVVEKDVKVRSGARLRTVNSEIGKKVEGDDAVFVELRNTFVGGDVVVKAGTFLSGLGVVSSEILGDVELREGARAQIVDSAVRGKVSAKQESQLELNRSSVRDKVDSEGDRVTIHSSNIDGRVSVEQGVHLDVRDSSFGGALQVKKLRPAGDLRISIVRSEIGELEVEESVASTPSSFEFEDNTIGGDFKFADNSGPSQINRNIIDGKLRCQGNNPPPAGGSNTADSKEGQCTGL